MSQNNFFNPTPLYREYLIMTIIENNPNATQRLIAKSLGVSATLVNKYLEIYEKEGKIERIYNSRKDLIYKVTKRGLKEKKNLNIKYLKDSLRVYNEAKGNVLPFLYDLYERGYKNILLYGAGEVCELFLYIIKLERNIKINVIGIIDDDKTKVGKKLSDIKIISLNDASRFDYDGILIASYNHQDEMLKNLASINISKDKIINFLG